jgi:uncharacterized protein (TIGR02594 family)
MSKLPTNYAWIAAEPGPKMVLEALKLYGTQERQGAGSNPMILEWAKELGLRDYTADSIPWCGLFVAIVAHRAGKPLAASPLWARSWANWGTKSPKAALGDILVFSRNGGGHVALYVGEDDNYYHCLGGNQGDAVSIVRISKERCIAVRRFYSVGVPANVRSVKLAANGTPSTNEA